MSTTDAPDRTDPAAIALAGWPGHPDRDPIQMGFWVPNHLWATAHYLVPLRKEIARRREAFYCCRRPRNNAGALGVRLHT